MNTELEAMTLGELITELEQLDDPSKYMRDVVPHSYRGYYERLGLEYNGHSTDSTVAGVLDRLRGALGTTYEGWKGGDYKMGPDTLVHVAAIGDTGEAIYGIIDGFFEVGFLTGPER